MLRDRCDECGQIALTTLCEDCAAAEADAVDEPAAGHVSEPVTGRVDLRGPALARAALAEVRARRQAASC
jgi:hypothetical protein